MHTKSIGNTTKWTCIYAPCILNICQYMYSVLLFCVWHLGVMLVMCLPHSHCSVCHTVTAVFATQSLHCLPQSLHCLPQSLHCLPQSLQCLPHSHCSVCHSHWLSMVTLECIPWCRFNECDSLSCFCSVVIFPRTSVVRAAHGCYQLLLYSSRLFGHCYLTATYCTIASKINGTPKGDRLSKTAVNCNEI